MKIFVYKTLFVFVCAFLLFQFTIGTKIGQLNNELERLKSNSDFVVLEELDLHLRYERFWWISIIVIPMAIYHICMFL